MIIKQLILEFLVLISLLLFSGCSIHPNTWEPPENLVLEDEFIMNNKLQSSEKIELLGYAGAEDFAIDSLGNIYTGVHKTINDFSSGAVLKVTENGKVEEVFKTEKWVTGMQFDTLGQFNFLMNGNGLLKMNDLIIVDTLVNQTDKDTPLLMGAGLDISKSGKIYFSNMSSKYETSSSTINRLILEQKKTGGLFCYNPVNDELIQLSDGNYFGNGLVVAEDESYVLLTETSKYRILKYWLKGENKGGVEVLIDNLPGFPNNLVRSSDGHYWVGFTTKRNKQLDQVHSKPFLKQIVYALPSFLQPKPEKFGMVFKMTSEGEIIDTLFDLTGEVIPEAGALLEYNGYLYLGGDNVTAIGKYKL